ncbi:hypothetical protein ABC955_00955 [Citromicrobium bathyomarinum]
MKAKWQPISTLFGSAKKTNLVSFGLTGKRFALDLEKKDALFVEILQLTLSHRILSA